MSVLFYTPLNNVESYLTASHSIGDGVLTVASGAAFGSPSVSAPVRVTAIRSSDNVFAIFAITAVSGNNLTIGSAIEGTSDITLSANDKVRIEITAGTLSDIHSAVNTVCVQYVSPSVHTALFKLESGQETNIIEIQNAAGDAVLTKFDSNANLTLIGGGDRFVVVKSTGGGQASFAVQSAASVYATIERGNNSAQAQFGFLTGGVANWYLGMNPAGTFGGGHNDFGLYDVAGAPVYRVYYNNAYFNVLQRLGVNEPSPAGMFQVTTNSVNMPGVIIKLMDNQNEDAVQVRNNLDVVIAGIDAKGVVKGRGFISNLVSKTAAYTITTSDGTINCNTTGGGFTVTLPAASGVATGRYFIVKKNDSSGNSLTLAADGSDKIDNASTYTLSGSYPAVTVQSDGVSNWLVIGKV